MPIWFNKSITIEGLRSISLGTMADYIGIELTEIGEDYIKGRMPVDHRTRQPYGLLHGGASVALAETLGSIASAYIIDQSKYFCVGLEINANHIRGAKQGYVYGTATPLHIGNSTHVWEIKIHDENEKLVCASRLTVAILKKSEP
ncbi:MAG: hotdog fold thioesterase [Bacteroidetes bacterium]|nr:hotdog fold thioesterase [Bacteroidota bacterium]MBS1972799.1 hotdog fold thioesterase [Bacteroidota bacterium]